MKRSFTLIELLVVIAIIALLAAIIFPVFLQAQRKSRQITCLSNLRQVGGANLMYAQDWDDLPVWGGDPPDLAGDTWFGNPDVAKMRPQHEVLMPYLKNREVWHCPADTGFEFCGPDDSTYLPSLPTAYQKWATSYITRTEIILSKRPLSGLEAVLPDGKTVGGSGIGLFFDASGAWHGERRVFVENLEGYRYNALYLDGHAKSLGNTDFLTLWSLRFL